MHIFIGYPNKESEYLCLVSDTGKVIVSRDMVFIENNFGLGVKIGKVSNLNQSGEVILLAIPIIDIIDISVIVAREPPRGELDVPRQIDKLHNHEESEFSKHKQT